MRRRVFGIVCLVGLGAAMGAASALAVPAGRVVAAGQSAPAAVVESVQPDAPVGSGAFPPPTPPEVPRGSALGPTFEPTTTDSVTPATKEPVSPEIPIQPPADDRAAAPRVEVHVHIHIDPPGR
jgi:hypothetical protein